MIPIFNTFALTDPTSDHLSELKIGVSFFEQVKKKIKAIGINDCYLVIYEFPIIWSNKNMKK